jgi:hypothetical protein
MRRFLVVATLAVMLAGAAAPALAHDSYDDTQSHPLRIAAYGLNPIGWALEWLALRPMHFVVSNPQLERIFGHTPHEDPFGDYHTYQVGEP